MGHEERREACRLEIYGKKIKNREARMHKVKKVTEIPEGSRSDDVKIETGNQREVYPSVHRTLC